MFIKVDKDYFINIDNICAYKLSEDLDSYKLLIWTCDMSHTIIYMKSNQVQMNLLSEVNEILQNITINKEKLNIPDFSSLLNSTENSEEQPKHIEEKIDIENE